MPLVIKMTPRARFIATEGILRRGTTIGTVVAGLFILGSVRDGALETEKWQSAVLAVLCFLEWSLLAGWLIGSFMWTRRHQRDAHGTQHLR